MKPVGSSPASGTWSCNAPRDPDFDDEAAILLTGTPGARLRLLAGRHIPHWVAPPAQLLTVPTTLAYSRSRSPDLLISRSVVQPRAPGS